MGVALSDGMADGKVTAPRELFVRNHRWVRAIAKRRFGIGMADVDDVVQKVFIVAYGVMQTQTVRAERAWLLAITRRVCANERRNLRLRRESEAQYTEPVRVLGAAPDSKLMLKETLGALGKLDVRQREVVELTCFEGLSLYGAACRLGVSPQLAERRLERVKCTLDRYWDVAVPVAGRQSVEAMAR